MTMNNDNLIFIGVNEPVGSAFVMEDLEDGISVCKEDESIIGYAFDRSSWTVLNSIIKAQSLKQGSISQESITNVPESEVAEAFEHRVLVTAKAEIKDVDTINVADLVAKAHLENLDPDLLPVAFKLVHANTNLNKDRFLDEELIAAEKTPILKPVNWQHDAGTIIGVMHDSEFIESTTADEDNFLQVESVIYKFLFPTFAEEMEERFENDELFFSMEVWYTEAECSECGAVASHSKDYCSHLRGRHRQGSSASRILRGLIFGGAGVVENPADVDAAAVDFGSPEEEDNETQANASDKTEDKEMTKTKDGQIQFETQAEFDAYIEEKLAAIAATSDVEELKAQATELQAALDSAKAELEEAQAKIEELEKGLEEATAAKDEATEALAAYEAEKAANEALAAKLEELAEAGIKLPEDEAAKDKLVASIKAMDDETFAGYKAAIVASLEAAASTPAGEGKEDGDGQEGTEASTTTPVDNPAAEAGEQATASEEGSMLRTLLARQNKK